MALIVCPECGNQVSDQARMCPKCGYLLQKSKTEKAKKWVLGRKNVFIFLIAIIFLGVVIFGILRGGLNNYEKQALENCRALQQALINPQSSSPYSFDWVWGVVFICGRELRTKTEAGEVPLQARSHEVPRISLLSTKNSLRAVVRARESSDIPDLLRRLLGPENFY